MPLLADLKSLARISVDAQAWRGTHRMFLAQSLVGLDRNSRAGYSDDDHLRAAAEWLGRAQDATGDGGVAGRYSLMKGWTSSYPETTGYLIPTLLRLAEVTGDASYRDRAKRCLEFLLGVQLESGAFPGMEIAENRTQPSIFNTAQIINGLRAWHAATGEERVLVAMKRACDWLVAEQDADGAWRKHLYGKDTYSYMSHAGCWIAEMGEYLGEQRYLDSARAHLEWVLAQQNPESGFFDKSGFSIAKHHKGAVTHTIAYTIWGVLMMSRILGHERGLAAARFSALRVARRLELSRWLPGVLDENWKSQANYACPTGNAQMALVWFELHRLKRDPALVSAACKALDLVKRAQPMHSAEPGIRGGIPGSAPIWGGYVYMSLPNWAAKFFIDALLVKREVLAGLAAPPSAAPAVSAGVPSTIPAKRSSANAARPRIVMLASPGAHKVEQMVKAWSGWGFKPDCVVLSSEPDAPARTRLWKRIQQDGLGVLIGQKFARRTGAAGPKPHPVYVAPGEPVDSYCRRMGIRFIEVGPLDSPAAIAAVQAQQPDLAIYAGAGILRKGILDVPRIGTINAHMGILPEFRGMNVAEWSRWYGVPTGCTVHLVDPGIDTGDIVCVRAVSTATAKSIFELRQLIDAAQIALLGEVVEYVVATGELPARRSQQAGEGRQYFAMHPEVRQLLDQSLAGS